METKGYVAVIVCAVVFFGAGIGVGWVIKPEPEPMDRVTFMFDWLPKGEFAALYMAHEQGFDLQNGLIMDYSRGYGAEETLVALAEGTATLGLAAPMHILRFRNEGGEATIVGGYLLQPPYGYAMLESYCGAEATPEDLTGATVSYQPAGTIGSMLEDLCAVNGIDFDTITMVQLDPSVEKNLFFEGDVQAIPEYETGGWQETRVIAERDGISLKFLRWAEYGMDIYSKCIVVSDELLADNPDLVERCLQAIYSGIKYAIANPDECFDTYMKYNPVADEEMVQAQIDALLPFYMEGPGVDENGYGWLNVDRMTETIRNLVEDLGEPNVPPEECYTNDYNPGILP